MSQSKKFWYCVMGLAIVLPIYGITLWLVAAFPSSQNAYIQLFNTVVPYVAGLIAILTGTHTFMDWHAMNQSVDTISQETESLAKEIHAPKYYDDETIP